MRSDRPFARHGARLLAALILAGAIACGGSDSTSPGGDSNTGGSAKPTHPEGTLGSRITLSSEADGVAIDSSGTAFVAMNYEGAVARFRVDAPTPALQPVAVGNIAQDVVVNRAGTTAYAGSSGKVSFIDVATGTVTKTVGIPGDIQRLALSPDGSRLYATVSATVYMIPTAGGPVISVPLTSSLFGVTTAPSGNAVYAAGGGSVWKLDPITLAVQTKVSPTGPFFGDLVVSLDGKEVYAAQDGGALYVLDATTLATVGGVDLKSAPTAMAITPDGTQLYIASNSTGKLQVVDRATRAVLKSIDLGGFPHGIAFDRLGKVALVTNENGWVDVIR